MEVYFDNAATSWPKPESVYQAADYFMRQVGANPGRSGHTRSLSAGRILFHAREVVSTLFGCTHEDRIVFTLNATDSINMAMKGYLKAGDHVITSSMEHNAVMRPLMGLHHRGLIELTVVPCVPEGILAPEDIMSAIRSNTRMVVLTHASNVTGSIMPVAQIGKLTREQGICLLVDAAQTAGTVPIHVEEMGIDMLAFTGHKGLMGPQGTGGLYVREGIDLAPWREGGTGSISESDRHPEFFPDALEAGTPNTSGIAGLTAGIEYIFDQGIDRIRVHETELSRKLWSGLIQIPNVTVYGPHDRSQSVAVVSLCINGKDPAIVGHLLDTGYGVACRTGLHCAPHAHMTIGTYPTGTIRFSMGYFNSLDEVDYVIDAVSRIAFE